MSQRLKRTRGDCERHSSASSALIRRWKKEPLINNGMSFLSHARISEQAARVIKRRFTHNEPS